ncbi:transport and Golgi organization protein 6-like [Solea senegalensis]|uniref:Transport and Golgi organization protein 6-like n=1 Tax=Solea senegalensis TaxID=28829 RepID=A0AAV6PGF6_SOLSE|nr:transport and Golgi organization protein 6-like [Solea senegalensis]
MCVSVCLSVCLSVCVCVRARACVCPQKLFIHLLPGLCPPGELVPHLGRPLVGVFLQGTRDVDQSVRASSLSNLGELCQKLDYAVGPLAAELSSCLTALIKTEKEAEVRRAAVHVITLLLRGLSNKTTQLVRTTLSGEGNEHTHSHTPADRCHDDSQLLSGALRRSL